MGASVFRKWMSEPFQKMHWAILLALQSGATSNSATEFLPKNPTLSIVFEYLSF